MSGVFPAPHRAFHRLQRTPQMSVDVGSVVQSEPNQEVTDV
ncbi:hypothetical protein SEA_ALEXPHANDER_92 [Mycobacterium phage Alexphander]|nr:hypothetical protein SEA_ALEXPHANDER_92 [Mycobacterium phage Alexphander]